MTARYADRQKRQRWSRQLTLDRSDDLYSPCVVEGLIDCFVSRDSVSAIHYVEHFIDEFRLRSLDHLLKLPEVLSTLQVDVFWILHLNGYMRFLEYISLIGAPNVTDFIRRSYLASNTSSDTTDGSKNAVPLSICANIVLYLFNMTIAPDTPPSLIKKMKRILDDAFLQSPRSGLLKLSDILVFSDLIATISCNIERDALQELQVEQISRLLSHQICVYSTSPSSLSYESSIYHTTDYSASTHGSEQSGTQKVIDNQKSALLNCTDDPFDCLINLQLPLIVYLKAFDRALRAEVSKSPFDFELNNTLMAETTPGTYSVISLLFESASLDGLSTWKSTIPLDLNAETISHYAAINLIKSGSKNSMGNNNLLLSQRSTAKLFPLLSMLYLATASARAGITEGSHILWLRAVCFAERIAYSMHVTTSLAVPVTSSTRESGIMDPGSTLFSDWFDLILGSTSPFNNDISSSRGVNMNNDHDSGNEFGQLHRNNVEVTTGDRAEVDIRLEIRNHNRKAVINAKTFEFACLALCDCISYQREKVIQIILKALRTRRALSKDAVDIYLHAARIELARRERLVASHSKTESNVQTVLLSPERVLSWASTLRRTGFLPVGVSQTCKKTCTS